jgi:hypothetical protein
MAAKKIIAALLPIKILNYTRTFWKIFLLGMGSILFSYLPLGAFFWYILRLGRPDSSH